MPVYMDRHTLHDVSAEDVAHATSKFKKSMACVT